MVFKSDRQRKAVMAKLSKDKCSRILANKISKNIREGKPQKQAIAIGFSQARKKGCPFPKQSKNPKKKSMNIDQNKLFRTLIPLVGLVVALRILRGIRR